MFRTAGKTAWAEKLNSTIENYRRLTSSIVLVTIVVKCSLKVEETNINSDNNRFRQRYWINNDVMAGFWNKEIQWNDCVDERRWFGCRRRLSNQCCYRARISNDDSIRAFIIRQAADLIKKRRKEEELLAFVKRTDFGQLECTGRSFRSVVVRILKLTELQLRSGGVKKGRIFLLLLSILDHFKAPRVSIMDLRALDQHKILEEFQLNFHSEMWPQVSVARRLSGAFKSNQWDLYWNGDHNGSGMNFISFHFTRNRLKSLSISMFFDRPWRKSKTLNR